MKQKGQGIVEYALLLAFIVGIAIMLNGGGLKDAVVGVFDDVAWVLKGDKSYSDYFHAWRTMSLADLANKDNAERIKADQEGLEVIAQAFLGLDENGVKELMNKLSGSAGNYGNANAVGLNNYAEGDGGYSGVMIPLSYNTKTPTETLDGTTGYIWLDANNNQNTVKLLASDANAYDKTDQSSPYYNSGGANTSSTDRIFYSNDMISNNGQRSVALQVHYNDVTHKVDSVNIAAYTGRANNTTIGAGNNVAEGLNLTVTSSGYMVNQ